MYYDPHYVTMIDTFMSNWGPCSGLRNLLIIECDNSQEADIVATNARNRGDQQNVKIHDSAPQQYLPNRKTDEHGGYVIKPDGYYVQIKTQDDMPNWFKDGAFKK